MSYNAAAKHGPGSAAPRGSQCSSDQGDLAGSRRGAGVKQRANKSRQIRPRRAGIEAMLPVCPRRRSSKPGRPKLARVDNKGSKTSTHNQAAVRLDAALYKLSFQIVRPKQFCHSYKTNKLFFSDGSGTDEGLPQTFRASILEHHVAMANKRTIQSSEILTTAGLLDDDHPCIKCLIVASRNDDKKIFCFKLLHENELLTPGMILKAFRNSFFMICTTTKNLVLFTALMKIKCQDKISIPYLHTVNFKFNVH